ncbi:3-hydroxyacyl-ACP dehydratase FabZ family protein [Candidatus Magnetomonas plexicatena]|uniref:3-hydroxyacyl-ACP dehydratase FabZ family protein n=1 Tax=Candidatus Magnetomonas plexicatena TaxID=2552947 RepID=UPI001C762976|nr:beta-hydroxyacyl-ACP dehydratase [Nitrospirales bacterium LBB_01]
MMRFLLIDRIVEVSPGKSIKGIKNVAMSEDFLEFHFPKNPVMPGVMLIESLVQLAGWLTCVTSEFKEWFLPEQIEKAKFYSFALAGDQVELEVTLTNKDDDGKLTFSAMGNVAGKKKVIAVFSGVTIGLDQLETPADIEHMYKVLKRDFQL